MGLCPEVLDALQPLGYTEPTPIQTEAIPLVIEGKDVLGCAQTGTGKTAAFALPIIHNLFLQGPPKGGRRQPRGLILTPTRELATQIGINLQEYSSCAHLRSTTIFGGVSQHRQVEALRRGVDIVAATPGRLLDLVNQRHLDLSGISMLVLDEADTMLDMGFIRDIQKIINMLPKERQTLFFSATMPPNIVRLANDILTNPVRVEVARESSAAETVEQTIYSVRQNDKRELLVEILKRPEVESALVFTRTKFGADKVAKYLSKAGVHSEAIHGNKSQPQRDRAMNGFKKGKFRVLIATDIASRGIDVNDLSHVINFELPNISESYVHRIGRTGRAGASGQAISFCNEGEERKYLRDIQRLIQKEIFLETSHEWHLNMPPVGTESHPASKGGRKSSGGKSKGGNGGGGGNYGYGGYKGTSSDGRRDRPGGSTSGNGRKPQRSEGGRSGATGRPSSNDGAPKRWDNNRSESNAPRRAQPARSDGRSGDRRGSSSETPRRDQPKRYDSRSNDGRSSRSGESRPQRSHDRRPASSNDGRSPRSSEGSSNSSSDNRRPNKSAFKPAEPTKARKSFGGFFGFGKEDS